MSDGFCFLGKYLAGRQSNIYLLYKCIKAFSGKFYVKFHTFQPVEKDKYDRKPIYAT